MVMVKLKTHGWKKIEGLPEYGDHEGLKGSFYPVQGFSWVHEKYIEAFRY